MTCAALTSGTVYSIAFGGMLIGLVLTCLAVVCKDKVRG